MWDLVDPPDPPAMVDDAADQKVDGDQQRDGDQQPGRAAHNLIDTVSRCATVCSLNL